MLKIKLLTTGALSESYFKDAAAEYIKRLGAYCSFSEECFKEVRLPSSPSKAEIAAALDAEGERILASVPQRAMLVALCIEGKEYSSPELAKMLSDAAVGGTSEIVFVIGSSFGLSDKVKARADVKLSMSRLTFPHQMAKVMLLETVYRALDIAKGGKYHK